MTRVLICSEAFYQEDMKYISPQGLEIETDVQISRLQDSVDFKEKASRADMILFFLTGDNPSRFMDWALKDPFYKELFSGRGPRMVLWSYDSHHMYPLEIPVQKYFDAFYISHESCRHLFKPDNLHVIPCAHFNSVDGELLHRNHEFEIHRDICFPYGLYEWSPRNRLAYEADKIFREKGLNYMFGRCYGDELGIGEAGNFRWLMASSKACFNLSLLNDFNMRNWETMACNRILLTNKVAEHDIVDMDLSHTFFFKRDLSDLPEVLEEALAADVSTCKSADNILHNHLLSHRYLHIINQEMGTSYELNIPEAVQTDPVVVSDDLLKLQSDTVQVYDCFQLAVNCVSASVYEAMYDHGKGVFEEYAAGCDTAQRQAFATSVVDTIEKSFRIKPSDGREAFLRWVKGTACRF